MHHGMAVDEVIELGGNRALNRQVERGVGMGGSELSRPAETGDEPLIGRADVVEEEVSTLGVTGEFLGEASDVDVGGVHLVHRSLRDSCDLVVAEHLARGGVVLVEPVEEHVDDVASIDGSMDPGHVDGTGESQQALEGPNVEADHAVDAVAGGCMEHRRHERA